MSTVLPTIALTGKNLHRGASSWVATRKNVKAAMEEYGCFVAIHELFSSETSAAISTALQCVFDLPDEVKKRNVSDNPYFGYRGPKPSMPLYESVGVFETTSKDVEAIQTFTNVFWPSGNQTFCEIMEYSVKKLSELELSVIRMIYESYGLEKYHDSFVGSLVHLLRLMIYRAPESSDEHSNVGIVAHTDKSFISILHQTQVNGLQIKTKGGKWISVDFPPSSVLVMAGDSLLAWSSGRIHSPIHRVIMEGREARYTLGLFSYYQGLLQAPEELIDDEHPLLYKPFDGIELLVFSGTEKGRQVEDHLKAYCGV